MIFNVKKAETEQFRFSSPISVASIRGTKGGYVTGGNADSLTITDNGLADFTNSISGKTGPVAGGQTGVADSSGNFQVHQADERTLNGIRHGQNFGDDNESGPNLPGGVGPEFGHLKSKHVGSVRVNLSSFHGKAIAVSLFYRKQNEQAFTELVLSIMGQIATGQLPANKVKYPKLEYYLSIGLKDGSTIVVPPDGATKPAVVPVEAVQRTLRIPGQLGSLQEKVVVLKWNE
jgi:hypothetical protein